MHPAFLSLQGYLNKEKINQAKNSLDTYFQSSPLSPTLVIELNSSGGDLGEVLDLAKKIYQLKRIRDLHVTLYIDENALGPAAILPFLADSLESSLFVSWGDIPLGIHEALPANILRNQVRSLVNSKSPQASLLLLIADAMSDPSLQVINDEGWRLSSEKEKREGTVISSSGQTLVLNQNQLQELALIQEPITLEDFEKRFHLTLQANRAKVKKEDAQPLQLTPQTVEKRLSDAIHIHSEGPNMIGYLYIGGHEQSVSESTWLYIKQGLEFYKKEKPIFVILELNTPGGEVFAAQKISDALKEMDTQFNIPVVAFINNWAISAGAMLAYSCRFIATVKDGSMGAAEPVFAGEGGKMESASEKVNSALRADFANRASFFDRNPLIAEAMVDKDKILVLRHGEVVALDDESLIRRTGPDPDGVITSKGKLLTLNAGQMINDGVADLLVEPSKLQEITPEEKVAGEWPADKNLLFHAPFFDTIPRAVVKEYKMDWKTQLFVWLTTPLISSLLFMGLIVGAYVEMNSPGLGFPGFVAGCCLFLIVLASFSLQIAHWLELIFLLTGFALILTELFILPTFGLLGILGAFLFFGGLFGMLLPSIGNVHFEYDTQTFNAAGEYFMQRLAWLCGSLIVSAIIIAILARYVFPSFPGLSRFVLSGHEQDASLGYTAGNNPIDMPTLGAQAEVFATLRPAGKIIVNGRIYDAISTGELISTEEKVIITAVEGSTIIVKRNTIDGALK